MDNSKTKPYADLRVKTGTYMKDGKTKNRYANIGTLFATPHFSNMYIQIDTLPVSKDWDGRVYVNTRDQTIAPDKSDEVTHRKDTVLEDIDDKPIDLGEIPFL